MRRDCILNKVRVKVHQLGVFSLWVEHSNEIEGFVILASSYSTGGLEVEYSLEAVEVLRLDRVEAQSDWYGHEAAVSFHYLLVNFVEEDISIIADDNAEV